MIIWTKWSSASRLKEWEDRFHASANPNLVISRNAGSQRIRVDVYCHRRENAEALRQEFGGAIHELKPQDWAAQSAARLKPVSIRGRLIITHSPAEAQQFRQQHPDKHVLCIPSALAFGTGDHATTSTCLRMLADFAAAQNCPWDAVDIGCGTGILAIAARKLGAAGIEAFDFDPTAVRVAQENAAANGCRGLRIFQQDIARWRPNRRFDFLLANLFFDILTNCFPVLAKAAKPGATLVLSGILASQARECLAAGRKAGFRFLESKKVGKWVTARAVRSPHG
jgi:ribosomal protein L11 methyltransferase